MGQERAMINDGFQDAEGLLSQQPEFGMTNTKPIAYRLAGHDNKGHFFEDCPDGTLCPACKNCVDWSYVPTKISLPRSSRYDVSATYDNRILWSTRALEAILELKLVDPTQVSKITTGYFDVFYFVPSQTVPFDVTRSRTKIARDCEVCGKPRDVSGSTPTFLSCQELPGRGIFRTDLAFGSGQERFPLLVADLLSAQALREWHFRGLTFFECNFDPSSD